MQLLKSILSENWQHSHVSLKLDSRKAPGVISRFATICESYSRHFLGLGLERERILSVAVVPKWEEGMIQLPRKHLAISENMFGRHNLEELCWHSGE